MAQLNFPDPSVTTTYIEAGITWTWNATLGVWSSDPNDFDSDYLKLDATNGPVTGPLTFEGLTTHEGGVSVTGGNLVINPGQIKQGATTSAAAAGSGVQIKGFVRQYCNETDFPEGDKNDEQPFQVISAPNDASTKAVVLSLNASGSAYFKGLTEHAGGVDVKSHSTFDGQIQSTCRSKNGKQIECKPGPGTFTCSNTVAGSGQFVATADTLSTTVAGAKYSAFLVDNSFGANVTLPSDGVLTGFRSYVDTDHSDIAYNFYSAGTAPNYFAGSTFFGTVGNGAEFSDVERKTVLRSDGRVSIRGVNGYASLDVYNDRAAGATTGFNDIAWFHDISASAADGKDSISISYNLTDSKYTITLGLEGNVQTVSDYRVKSNIADLTGATDIIKALKPRSYNFLDRGTRVGFVAHELEAHVPEAVTGIKDAEETIGTLADYDGTVLETAVVEPPAEELTYTENVEVDGVTTQEVRTKTWTATGTRPVYQGVDQTKLIPLLTKALQEALGRIEALEAGNGGVATMSTAKKK
jgi:hypothetical protein